MKKKDGKAHQHHKKRMAILCKESRVCCVRVRVRLRLRLVGCCLLLLTGCWSQSGSRSRSRSRKHTTSHPRVWWWQLRRHNGVCTTTISLSLSLCIIGLHKIRSHETQNQEQRPKEHIQDDNHSAVDPQWGTTLWTWMIMIMIRSRSRSWWRKISGSERLSSRLVSFLFW